MNERKRTKKGEMGFPIVGIGASAGGLEALTELLKQMPVQTGMAFIIVQHLHPKHESLAPEILSRVTQMPVREVKEGTRVEPNHVYLIPPNYRMEISKGVLHLLPRIESSSPGLLIDVFFQSLALDQKNKAIGVVLSGVASDGTLGLRAIKSEGGLTCVQEPLSAKYDGMPKSAIASGNIDLILPPGALAQELARIASHPYIIGSEVEAQAFASKIHDGKTSHQNESLRKIFVLLRNKTRVDFENYKHTTINRRIERRIAVNKMENLAAYVKYLQGNPDEVKALFEDILINVTNFFRDPEAFKTLKENVFRSIVKNRNQETPIRVWVPGCATGEEVYSIAISLLEVLVGAASRIPIQIFATDISEMALQAARAGVYTEAQTSGLSQERLKQFFIRSDGGYKINKTIRDMCVFSRHDVTSDPPFARLDLISCRNLLIYLSPLLQKRVIPIFHYALNPNGFLFLGLTESVAGYSKLFTLVDQKNRIYSKINTPTPMTVHFPLSAYVPEAQDSNEKPHDTLKSEIDLQKDADRIALAEYAPPGVVINHNMEVLQFRGRTGPFLEPAPGQSSHNLLKMFRAELLPGLRMSVQSARKTNTVSREEGIRFKHDGIEKIFNIKVIPMNPLAPPLARNYLVLFEDVSSVGHSEVLKSEGIKAPYGKSRKKTSSKTIIEKHIQRNAKLERELHASREHQDSLTAEYEASREELTSTNEELQSTNEELQSTNEELQTAQEELQASNEELSTVNDELHNRNADLDRLNNDLLNLLGSIEIPILMVGRDSRIRRFTPQAEQALNIIPTDIGRPLSDIRSDLTLSAPDMERMISQAVESLHTNETEVQDSHGRWYRLQVRPYKTTDNKIDGAVLSLVDIDALKRARADAETANRTKDLFLATLSHELRTPLTAILSWAQLLRMGKTDQAKAKRGIEVIELSAKTQGQLIDDLLDISRIQAGKLTIDMRIVDPAAVIHGAIDSVQVLAESKSIQIETIMSQTGRVYADPARLQQVIWNLLTNSIKFSAQGSKVEVQLNQVEKTGQIYAQITVRDSGKGIRPEFLPRIFDRFSQGDSSSTRQHGGLGLGLAITHKLMELQGGAVHAESLGEGKGASFRVEIPLALNEKAMTQDSGLESTRKSTENIEEQISLDGLRVLLVDDEANTREALMNMLHSFGAEVKVAASVDEALKIFTQLEPHILVSDIAMPDEDGFSLIRKIRALGQHGQIPLLALTAYASAEDVKRASDAGFQAHLAKPVDGTELIRVIARLAGRNGNG